MSALYVAVVRAQDKDKDVYIVLTTPNGYIRGFSTEADGVTYFERTYHAAHTRGYEWSMSACLSYILYNPSIVSIKDSDTVRGWVNGTPQHIQLWGVAGGVEGIVLNTTRGRKAWDSGVKPTLMPEPQ